MMLPCAAVLQEARQLCFKRYLLACCYAKFQCCCCCHSHSVGMGLATATP
jgi:hypothetical protein